MKKRVTPEQVNEMRELRARGFTNEQVGRHMSVSYATVLNHIGLQEGYVASISDPPMPKEFKPYKVTYWHKEIKFARSGAVVTISDNTDVAVSYKNDVLVFTLQEFKVFVDDMRMALEA